MAIQEKKTRVNSEDMPYDPRFVKPGDGQYAKPSDNKYGLSGEKKKKTGVDEENYRIGMASAHSTESKYGMSNEEKIFGASSELNEQLDEFLSRAEDDSDRKYGMSDEEWYVDPDDPFNNTPAEHRKNPTQTVSAPQSSYFKQKTQVTTTAGLGVGITALLIGLVGILLNFLAIIGLPLAFVGFVQSKKNMTNVAPRVINIVAMAINIVVLILFFISIGKIVSQYM